MNNYYLDKSQTSINNLIQDNLDLVKKIAWQLHGRVQNIVEVEDLIQQGMEGLVHAAQKYSPKEGVNFSQYAQLRIRGSIIDFLRKNSNLCRTTIKKKQEFEKCKVSLQKELSREPSKYELIVKLGITDDDERVNPNGGAIALGHPLGMSGTRLVLTAAHELIEKNKKYALCTMCVGVGQGSSIILERV